MAKDIRQIGNITVFTLKAVCKKLQVSQWAVRQAIKNKKLQAVKFGRHYLITENALDNFLNNKKK